GQCFAFFAGRSIDAKAPRAIISKFSARRYQTGRHGHRKSEVSDRIPGRKRWRLPRGNWEIRGWKLPRSCLAETYSDGRQTKQLRSAYWIPSLRQDSTLWIRLTFIPNGCREIEAGSPRRSSANG